MTNQSVPHNPFGGDESSVRIEKALRHVAASPEIISIGDIIVLLRCYEGLSHEDFGTFLRGVLHQREAVEAWCWSVICGGVRQ
jgi:hypothetical protein